MSIINYKRAKRMIPRRQKKKNTRTTPRERCSKEEEPYHYNEYLQYNVCNLRILTITPRFHEILNLLEINARRSSMLFQFGSCIMKGKTIISSGWNIRVSESNRPVQIGSFNLRNSMHAEVNAIYRLIRKYGRNIAKKMLNKSIMFVGRVTFLRERLESDLDSDSDSDSKSNYTDSDSDDSVDLNPDNIYRQYHNGYNHIRSRFMKAKPCALCQKYIKEYRIKCVYYTNR